MIPVPTLALPPIITTASGAASTALVKQTMTDMMPTDLPDSESAFTDAVRAHLGQEPEVFEHLLGEKPTQFMVQPYHCKHHDDPNNMLRKETLTPRLFANVAQSITRTPCLPLFFEQERPRINIVADSLATIGTIALAGATTVLMNNVIPLFIGVSILVGVGGYKIFVKGTRAKITKAIEQARAEQKQLNEAKEVARFLDNASACYDWLIRHPRVFVEFLENTETGPISVLRDKATKLTTIKDALVSKRTRVQGALDSQHWDVIVDQNKRSQAQAVVLANVDRLTQDIGDIDALIAQLESAIGNLPTATEKIRALVEQQQSQEEFFDTLVEVLDDANALSSISDQTCAQIFEETRHMLATIQEVMGDVGEFLVSQNERLLTETNGPDQITG
jgi:hypothetical protein